KVDTESEDEFSNISTSANTASQIKKQTTLANYVLRPLSNNDKSHFENLLPNRHAISDRILSKISVNITKEILQKACADKIGVIAAFDGWTNIKREHLFGVVLITSWGKPLIWNVSDISNQRSMTENAKLHIKNIMNDAEKNTRIKK
ncbi:8597_t:CDS:2, partial [Cetraspora pellucida]